VAKKTRILSAAARLHDYCRNYRSPHHRGELDLVGWDGDVLCVIEVKTRTARDMKPAEAAVDREKQRELSLVARDFLRHMPASCRGGSTCSPYTTIADPTGPPSSCFRMRFQYRTIVGYSNSGFASSY